MSPFKNWLESQIETNHIKYFDYTEFSDIISVGKGGSGTVCKANWNSRKMTVALKILKVSSLVDESAWEEFVRELSILRKVFYHPNINQFLGITKDPEFGYAMVLQYADGGNLRNYLKTNQFSLSWFNKYRIALEIAQGLSCLHAENIVHRDLHSKNVLVHRGGMLIADFGLSKEESLITSNSLLRGIPAYIDPQCHMQKGYKRFKSSDIFSFGVLLWEISACGKIPFAELSDFMIMAKLVNGIREQRVNPTPDEYYDLYTECWDDNPEKRPKIDEIVKILEVIISSTSPPPPPSLLPPPQPTTKTTTTTVTSTLLQNTNSCNLYMTGILELNVIDIDLTCKVSSIIFSEYDERASASRVTTIIF